MLSLTEENTVALLGALVGFAAVVMAAGIPVIAKVFDRKAAKIIEQNTAEHDANKELLTEVLTEVKATKAELHRHIEWHMTPFGATPVLTDV